MMKDDECAVEKLSKNGLKNSSSRIFNSISIGGMLGMIFSILLVYLLLLGWPHTILSLSLLIDWIARLTIDEQIIAVLLIPIYLGILVFGGGLLGAKIGGHIQQLFYKNPD